METLVACLSGFLVATSIWLMLSGNLMRFLFGLLLLSNGVNLAILAAGRLTPGAPTAGPQNWMFAPRKIRSAGQRNCSVNGPSASRWNHALANTTDSPGSRYQVAASAGNCASSSVS